MPYWGDRMTMEFTLSVEQDEYRALYEVLAQQRRKRVGYWLMLLVSVAAAIAALLVSMPLFLGILLLLCSVSGLIWSVVYPRFQAWDAYRHRDMAAEIAAFTYRFEEDALHILHPTHAQVVPYTAIQQCIETETHFVLLAGNQAFSFAKNVIAADVTERLRELLSERLQTYKTLKVETAHRRRTRFAFTAAVIAVAVAVGLRGATYVRRPVTVTDGDHSLTLSLPQFMKDKGEGQYAGNGIEVYAEYVAKAEMQERIEPVLEDAAANIANYAAYLQKSQAVPTKGEWVVVSKTEYYMSYADGSSYRYTILRADGDGVWVVWFRSPGERQDTYYNRFDTWREDIYSK